MKYAENNKNRDFLCVSGCSPQLSFENEKSMNGP